MTAPAQEVPHSSAARTPTANLVSAFGGVWRLTYPKFLAPRHLLAAGLMLVGLGALAAVNAHQHTDYYPKWVVTSYLCVLVPLIAFVTSAGAMRDEMKSATVDFVLTRPIARPAFLVFKFVAHVIVAQLEFLLAAAVVFAIGQAAHVPSVTSALVPMLVAQVGLVLAFAAFGFLWGAVTSRYLVAGLIYGSIVEVGVGQIPTELNRLSMTHHVYALMQSYAETGSGLPTATAVLSTFGALLAFAAISLAIAAVVFTYRELNEHAEA